MRKEIGDAATAFGFLLLEVALLYDWVSGTTGGTRYENSPLYVIVLLGTLLISRSAVSVDNYFEFTLSLISVGSYLLAIVLSVVSFWRRRVAGLAGALALATVVIWIGLFLSLSQSLQISIDAGMFLAAIGGGLLLGAYFLREGRSVEGTPSPSAP